MSSSNGHPTWLDPLNGSSYLHPSGGEDYAPLRSAVVAQATAMGYDVPTMLEHPVMWADDQDPFGHVAGATYARVTAQSSFRLFESFGKTLGDKYEDFYHAKGVGAVIRSYTMNLKRQVAYPDCMFAAARLTDVRPDRYFYTTTIWSYRQQAIVAECASHVVFFDFRKAKVADLVQYGGVYADLHSDLREKSRKSNELYAQWVAEHRAKL